MRRIAAVSAVFAIFLDVAMAAVTRDEWKVLPEGKGRVHEFWEGDLLTRTEADSNADGKPDAITEFKNGNRHSMRADRDLDGLFEHLVGYNAKGILLSDEYDSNRDGKTDKFYYYPQGGRNFVIREVDRNFDGKVDTRSFSKWDANRASLTPVGNRMISIPTPGYRVIWEERDDNFDGVIDSYRDSQNKEKTRVGQKMDASAAKPVEESTQKRAVSAKTEEQDRITAMNERHGLGDPR